MKLVLSTLLLATTASATLVSFPLNSMFNGALYGKTFTITASPYTFLGDTNNSSFYVGQSTQVTPTGGTNPIVQLEPNYYSVQFPDSGFNFVINVPQSTMTLSAWNLVPTNSPIPSIYPIVPYPNYVAGPNIVLTPTNNNQIAIQGVTTFLITPTNMLVIGYSGPWGSYQGTNLFYPIISTNGFSH